MLAKDHRCFHCCNPRDIKVFWSFKDFRLLEQQRLLSSVWEKGECLECPESIRTSCNSKKANLFLTSIILLLPQLQIDIHIMRKVWFFAETLLFSTSYSLSLRYHNNFISVEIHKTFISHSKCSVAFQGLRLLHQQSHERLLLKMVGTKPGNLLLAKYVHHCAAVVGSVP